MTNMSQLFTWRSAVVQSGLPSTARLVALCLSLHMNERGGSCFPSQKTLSLESGLSVRTVRRCVAMLRDEQWLEVTYKERPSGRRAFYRATVPIEAYLRPLPVDSLDPPAMGDLWGEDTDDIPTGHG